MALVLMRRRNARRTHLDLFSTDFFAVSIYEIELNERKLILVFSWVLTHLVEGSWIVDGAEDLAASENLESGVNLLSRSTGSIHEIALRPSTFES
ncbi:hypothetical protein [Halalkalicoccus salilacus]|uniref:hypothetical protein n=1 Tax=Halalkalicoccus sp. GCM10025704 TaxID=3252662 RepID=UPI0036F3FEAC